MQIGIRHMQQIFLLTRQAPAHTIHLYDILNYQAKLLLQHCVIIILESWILLFHF